METNTANNKNNSNILSFLNLPIKHSHSYYPLVSELLHEITGQTSFGSNNLQQAPPAAAAQTWCDIWCRRLAPLRVSIGSRSWLRLSPSKRVIIISVQSKSAADLHWCSATLSCCIIRLLLSSGWRTARPDFRSWERHLNDLGNVFSPWRRRAVRAQRQQSS